MAVNNKNISVDAKAESAAFSGRLSSTDYGKNLIKPSVDTKSQVVQNIEMMKPGSSSLSVESFKSFIMGDNYVKSKMDTTMMGLSSNSYNNSLNPLATPSSNSGLAGMEFIRGSDDKGNIAQSSILMRDMLKLDEKNNNLPDEIRNVLKKEMMPAFENIGQYIGQMSRINTDNKNQSDEMPTIPPSNLVFDDRLEMAMQAPIWA